MKKIARVAIAIGFIGCHRHCWRGVVVHARRQPCRYVGASTNSWTNCVRHRFVALPSWRIGVTTGEQAVMLGARRAVQPWHAGREGRQYHMTSHLLVVSGLTQRSTGRAGTRLLGRAPRRGPSVSQIRWASFTAEGTR